MTTVERFVEWLRKEGCEVVDHGDCWTLWPKGEPTEPGYRTVEIEKDTDEEQPDLLAWILERIKGEIEHIIPQSSGWMITLTQDIDAPRRCTFYGPNMTLAAMRALTGEE